MGGGDLRPVTSMGTEEGADAASFPVLLPMFDLANHDPAAAVTWGGGNSSCSFTTTQEIPAGREVCISYDDKSNEERQSFPAPFS